jgi:hypothetical protein
MYKTYIAADKFAARKAKQDEQDLCCMGEEIPVDLNYASVPQDKDNEGNLDEAHELNLERFGLTEAGV